MDSLDFPKFDEVVSRAEGGMLGRFEVLQEIVGTVALTALHDPMSPNLLAQFYDWYVAKLLELYETAAMLAKQTPYHLRLYDTHRVALARIHAVLQTLYSLEIVEQVGEEIARIETE